MIFSAESSMSPSMKRKLDLTIPGFSLFRSTIGTFSSMRSTRDANGKTFSDVPYFGEKKITKKVDYFKQIS